MYNCERGWLRPTPACRGRIILQWLTAGCAVISLQLARKFQGGLGLEGVVLLLQGGVQKKDLESDLHRCLQQKKKILLNNRETFSPPLSAPLGPPPIRCCHSLSGPVFITELASPYTSLFGKHPRRHLGRCLDDSLGIPQSSQINNQIELSHMTSQYHVSSVCDHYFLYTLIGFEIT